MPHTLKLIADVAILTSDERVLLVRYADSNAYDHQVGWFLPDDGLLEREHPDTAAARILLTQLGLEGTTPTLDHIESFVGNSRDWHMVFHYRLNISDLPSLQPAGDLAEARWFSLHALPPRSDVAHHGWALQVLTALTTTP